MGGSERRNNENEQSNIFVENLINDVNTPFKEALIEYEERSKELLAGIRNDLRNLYKMLNDFQRIKWQYEEKSKELITSGFEYGKFNRESTEQSSLFYKNRLFHSMGGKFLSNEEKVNELREMNEYINRSIQEFIERENQFTREFDNLERFKFQTIVDAINRIIIFETNGDMNNKYDTKGMATQVESLQQQDFSSQFQVTEPSKIDSLMFRLEDELKYLDFSYGYNDGDHLQQKNDVEAFLSSIFAAKNSDDIFSTIEKSFADVVGMMKHSSGRVVFVQFFKAKMATNNGILKGKYIYDALITVFKHVLEFVLEQEDTEVGYEIVDIIK